MNLYFSFPSNHASTIYSYSLKCVKYINLNDSADGSKRKTLDPIFAQMGTFSQLMNKSKKFIWQKRKMSEFVNIAISRTRAYLRQ